MNSGNSCSANSALHLKPSAVFILILQISQKILCRQLQTVGLCQKILEKPLKYVPHPGISRNMIVGIGPVF